MVMGGGLLAETIGDLSGWMPDIYIGKPESHILECIISDRHIDLVSCIMIGDKYNTDIKFGKTIGISSALVETGCNWWE